MTSRLPEVGKLIIPGKRQADIREVVAEIEVEYATDQVSELVLRIVDPDHKLTASPLVNVGSVVTFDQVRWQVGTIESEFNEWGSLVTMRCRDPLAKKLRTTYKTSAEKKVAPSTWVARRVKSAGGRARIQPSASRGTISQSKTQSALDVIGDLAAQLDWSWTSYDGTFVFAARHYAWQGRVGLPTWTVTWKADPRSDALRVMWRDSDDDPKNRAEIELELPYDHGRRIRPWHLLSSKVPGARGNWLVESVRIMHDGVTPVLIVGSKPTKPSPKAGSSRSGS